MKKIGTMNLILGFIAVTLVIFTGVMVGLYRETGAIPDTLCTCVFGVLGGECGAMAWIKTTKERRQQRSWELQDRETDKMKEENT